MANFVSRNVLLCVVPAVVVLLSLYWFRKKKKMKPDISLPVKKSTLSVSNVYDSQGSIYSSVEGTSDLSNTLSDASSSNISSPENSLRTSRISGEALSENTSNCTEALSVSNHISKLNYHDVVSITNEHLTCNNGPQIQKSENSGNSNITPLIEINRLSSVECESKVSNDSPEQLSENISNSLHNNVNSSLLDNLQKCSSENEVIEKIDNESVLSNILSSSNISDPVEMQECMQKSEVSEISIIEEVGEEPVVSVEHTESKPCQDSNIESDSPDSHSSVLDENSLSSGSEESERQTDFKCKDSPSSVFDGNSIVSDDSEKTDISNEHNAIHLKTEQNYNKSNVEYVNDINSSSCVDSNKNEQYSIKLNKNSFLVKTILSADISNEVSNSNCVENSPSSSQHSYSLLPDSLHSFSSEESFLCVSKDDLGTIEQHNNQSTQLSKEVDSSEDNNCSSSVATSLTSEIISLDSENIISSTSSEKTSKQSEVIIDNLECGDATVSSTNDINKDATKVNGVPMPTVSHIRSLTSSDAVKYQDRQLEQNENKVGALDLAEMKMSAGVPGLFVYEFELPQELCGRLIGKQGKHVKSIKERTSANVCIKGHPFDSNLKTVVVEGSRSSVHEALEVIRRKFPPSQFPTVTLVQTNMISSHGVPLPESLQLHLPEGASCDVILSSLVSADHFFLQQPTHPTYPSLGTLDQCMITCYTQMDTPLLPQPVEAGVICAAPVMNGWFRAQIVYVFENRTECEIKFVDYGGFSQVSISSLRQIRSDFMTLPFQASECYLANVRPVDCNAGWSNEATSVFEELAQGQILQALLVEYAEDGIPCVHLYKVQGVSNMFINQELVERGLAVWVDNGHWDPH